MSVIAMLNWSVRVSEPAGEIQLLFQISQSYLLRVKDTVVLGRSKVQAAVRALYVFLWWEMNVNEPSVLSQCCRIIDYHPQQTSLELEVRKTAPVSTGSGRKTTSS